MSKSEFDLVIKAGRIFCSSTHLDGPGAVGVRGQRIAAAGAEVAGSAEKVLEFPQALLLPGLVDLHAHPANAESWCGVPPDREFLARGVTTVLSQGDAGADTWDAYCAHTIARSRIRIMMALNLAACGESGPGGCLTDLANVNVEACVRTIQQHGERIWGVAINTDIPSCGPTDPDQVLALGLQVADRADVPILFGNRRHPDASLAHQLSRLRSGDVVTYCLHPDTEGLLRDGHIKDEVWEARKRGILFDVGHGMNSFSFDVAERAIADGFYPDTISTDQYRRHVNSKPQHDLARTVSKLIASGMPEADAFKRVTTRPADILGLEGEVGTLKPGACADLTLLQWNPDAPTLTDVTGATRPGGCWEPVGVVRAGTWVSLV